VPVSLLDVNVLIALAWPNHIDNEAAHRWFANHRRLGWATCTHTQLAFLRLSTQPAAVKTVVSAATALYTLAANLADPDHEFWPLEYSVTDILPEIQQRIVGHQQWADALLLDLAIRRHGRLVTFDRRVGSLLPPDSAHRSVIQILPAE
jgi:toxin-antitoxin system PIN domain toxin